MIVGDKSLTPHIDYTATKAEVEATSNPIEGMRAVSTDSHESGFYNGLIWVWGSGGGAGTNSSQIDSSSGTSDSYGVLTGDINGVNKTFYVSASSYISGSLQVYLNGQLLTQGGLEDWSEGVIASGEFMLNIDAPIVGDIVIASYKFGVETTGNADTLDGYEASAFRLNSSVGTGTVTLDFGTGLHSKTITVLHSVAKPASSIVANINYTTMSGNMEDDIVIQPLEVKVGHVASGSFNITVASLMGKFLNDVNVNYIIMN
jgi:hypothetical protein